MDIRAERQKPERGWSAKYVADQVGLSKQSICEIEHGRRTPSLKAYFRLMELFGYSVPRLVFGEAGGEPSNPGESIPDTTKEGAS